VSTQKNWRDVEIPTKLECRNMPKHKSNFREKGLKIKWECKAACAIKLSW